LRSFVETLTDLPVFVVLSHAHIDHVGALEQYDCVHIHRNEETLLRNHCKDLPVVYVEDGQVFDLGDLSITAYHVPGHTPGGLVLYDESRRRLYAGDMLSDMTLYMYMDHCSLEDFIASMDKMLTLPFEEAITSHGTLSIGRESAKTLREIARGVLEGTIPIEVTHKEFTEDETAETARIGRYSMHV